MQRSDPEEVFKILCVKSRLKILEVLKEQGPMGTNDLAKIIGVTPAAISQHLRLLRQAGIVVSKRQGYFIPYSVDEEALEHCKSALDKVCNCENIEEDIEDEELKDINFNLEMLRKYKESLLKKIGDVDKKIKKLESESK
jgi:DNA-binding transcriptional ArsR family regulator